MRRSQLQKEDISWPIINCFAGNNNVLVLSSTCDLTMLWCSSLCISLIPRAKLGDGGGGGIQLRTGPTKLDRLWGGGDQSKESPGPLSWGHSVKELCLPCLTGSDEDEGGCVDTVSVPCCWGVVWCVGQMYHTSVPMMFIRLTCKPCWPTRSVRGTIIIIYNN